MATAVVATSDAAWPLVRLGDAVTVVNGGTPKSKVAEYWGGEHQWLTPADMGKMAGREIGATPRTITSEGLAKSSARLVPPNSVILSTRAPIGHLAINEVPMAFNQGCRGLVPSKDVDHLFLFYFLMANRNLLGDLGSGTTFKELSATNLKAVSMPLPPLEQQKRTVAVLDQAFAALDCARGNAEANLADSEELLENGVNAVFTDLASSSAISALAEIVHPDCTLSYGIVQPGDQVDGGLPLVRPVDLKQRFITNEGLKRISPERADGYARTKLVGGELLLCVRGSTGEMSVASDDLAGANVTRGIVPIRFPDETIIPEFAYFQLRSRYAQDQIAAGTYGAALMQINIKDLRKLRFICPDRPTQQNVVDEVERLLDKCERVSAEYRRQLVDLDDLRQSLLQKAFSGRLCE